MHGGDLIAQVLKAHGVRFVFTLCGGHISPILIGCKQREIRVIDVRHEVTTVFAADAVARLTGVPGVAAVTAGPGLTNTITAVKNAQMAQSPVVILGGATATLLKGRGSLQDIDQMALMRPHVKWAATARTVGDLVPLMTRALETAKEGVPGPVFIEVPVDLLYDEAMVRDWYADATPKGSSIAARAQRTYIGLHLKRLFAGKDKRRATDPDWPLIETAGKGTVRRVAKLLQRAERPVLIVGSGAMLEPSDAGAIAAAVEAIGAPVYLTGMARGLLGKDAPLHLRHKRRKALKEADVVLVAGNPFDFRLNYGQQISRKATLIAVNRVLEDLRKNRKPQVPIHADPGRFLIALGAAVTPAPAWQSWLSDRRAVDDARDAEIAAKADDPCEFVNPIAICQGLEAQLDDDSILVADGGDFVATASYIVKPRGPLRWLDPGVFGTLGVGAGFALGAKLVHPEAEVWVIWGDGSFGYGLAEYDTFVRHGVGVIGVIGCDASWMQIAREQVEVFEDSVGTDLQRTAYHAAVEGLGGRGFEIRDPAQIEQTLADAKAAAKAGSPVVINVQIGKTDFRKGSISM